MKSEMDVKAAGWKRRLAGENEECDQCGWPIWPEEGVLRNFDKAMLVCSPGCAAEADGFKGE